MELNHADRDALSIFRFSEDLHIQLLDGQISLLTHNPEAGTVLPSGRLSRCPRMERQAQGAYHLEDRVEAGASLSG